MSATTLDDTAYVLIAASSEAMLSLAAPSVARHLNISEAQAKAQLQAGRVQMGADGVQMMSVLKALGLEPRAESALLHWLSVTAPGEAAAAIAAEVATIGDPQSLEVEHPTGFFTVAMDVALVGSEITVRRSALLRTGGQTVVYIRKSPTTFERRSAVNAVSQADGLFAPSGFTAGEAVVTQGAQALYAAQNPPAAEE